MKTFGFLVLIFTISVGLQAQSLKTGTSTDLKKADQTVQTGAATVASQANIGSLIGQLTSNISDDAFTDAFKKDKSDFISKTSKISDAAGAASAIQSLQGGLLPSAMDAGWGAVKSKWLADSKSANTIQQVAGLTS